MYSLWSLAVLRADEAGVELARALALRPPGSPPVTLVGYSLGGCEESWLPVFHDHNYASTLKARQDRVTTSLSCLWVAFHLSLYILLCFLFFVSQVVG